tara:strand:+ start:157 stop:354 length:198 start_codon:yes stop_codon:yes gene_type:complete
MVGQPTVDRGLVMKQSISKLERKVGDYESLRTSLASQIADFEREIERELKYLKTLKKRFNLSSKN